MIVKWPGVTIPGSKNDNYLIIEDFYPSILEMAGVEDKTTVQKVDGKSFTGLLKNNSSGQVEKRPLFWHYPNEWGPKGPGIGAFSAIRKGDFKLIYYHIDESFELFNIREDIGEQNNLAATKPEKVKALANLLTAHLKEVAAQMPIHKESGTPVAYPGE
jgi:arylsulfatase A-like enzyme